MLVQLLPDQVMHYWDLVKEALENTLPPYVTDSDKKMEEMQMSFLMCKAVFWIYVNSEPRVIFCLTTRVIEDEFTGSRSLEITSIFSYSKIMGEEWIDGLETIKKYAKGKNCTKIIAYTDEPLVIKITQKLGFEAKYTFIEYLLEE